MKVKITKRILLSENTATMNTNGELVFTIEIKKIYYIWKIPLWITTKYIDGTQKQ